MGQGIGDRFQEETKYFRDRMPRGGPDWDRRPAPYKEYPESRKIALPRPHEPGTASVHEVLTARKSVRDFAGEPVTLEQLGCLLWASTGIQRTEQGHEFRTAPSAGALYPIETYVVVNRVQGLAPGLYHYSIRSHELEELKLGELGRDTAAAALGQTMCSEAAATFVWTAIFDRMKWKYKQRAYRYVYLDAGHIAGNLALAAVALGLGTCQIGALYDQEANELVGVDGAGESVIYMSVVGVPAPG